jgi:eukaryotic-like serine/threonine-protein kinase
MPLAAGDLLGPYKIISLVGAGGMGEVYRARDTRLDRTVAIKVLSSAIDSPATREQFEREARAISSLNAPNVCALFDIGAQDGHTFLVMEYLDGETLSERLARGPLPIDKVFEYAIQIASGLDRAHRQGVVHRDLKPSNIMLTRSGAKLLDFGLATTINRTMTWTATAGTPDDVTTATASGPLVGTCQYMAPELLSGRKPDARSDIFSFGATLYEMITGSRAFQGETQAITIVNVLERDPPPVAAAGVSDPRLVGLTQIVKTCLAKDPEERRQSAHDVVLDLRWLESTVIKPQVAAAAVGSRRKWMWAAAGVLSALVLGGAFLVRRPAAPGAPLKLSVLPPEKATFAGGSLPAISPDGHRLAFAATRDGKTLLWIRDLDALSAWPLPGSDNATYPFWSPDSTEVAFFSSGKLRKVPVSGGPAVPVCDALQGRGGTWSPNGTILFSPSTGDPLYRVPAEGGIPSPVTALDVPAGEVSHRWPWFLPDGRHFLYTGRNSDPTRTAVRVGDINSKSTQKLVAVASNAVYTAPGFLLYTREGALMARRFDAGALRFTGEPFAVAPQVDVIVGNVQAAFAASDAGVLAYYAGGGTSNSQLAWFDRSGARAGNIGEPGSYVKPALSPDGYSLAVDRIDPLSGTTDIWLHDLLRATSSRFTFEPKMDGYPVWSPDGAWIAFSSNRSGRYQLYRKPAGGGADEVLLASDSDKFPADWSADGKYLLYYESSPKTRNDLWVLPLAGDRKPYPLLASEFNEHRGRTSPDGRWLAYTSDETSRDEIYVQAFPTLGHKWKVSIDGGSRPVWSRDGRELFYIAADRKLMAAPVKRSGNRLLTDAPKPLFETRQTTTRFFDVSADSRRFILVDPLPEPVTPPMNLLVNWTAAAR